VEVLERLGYGVTATANVCCGRPLISQGLLDEARMRARQNVVRLSAILQDDRPLLFFEPSCLSAIREDAPDLLRGDERRRAQTIAARSVLFEEWLEGEARSGRARLTLKPGPATVLVHGHCHQKSMGALAAAKALLERIPGARIVDPDAGCCGMAGSFGYMKGHFEISRAIGERRLLPAARALDAGAVVVASGTSCRQQLADFAGVRALHAVELVHNLLTLEP
jgi:Fe-S oxidoreductase